MCGCTSTQAPNTDFAPLSVASFLPAAAAPKPKWHVVVVSNATRQPLPLLTWMDTLCQAREDVRWTLVDTSSVSETPSYGKDYAKWGPAAGDRNCRYMALPPAEGEPFNLGYTLNMTRLPQGQETEFTCFLHDDVTMPKSDTPGAWLDAFAAAFEDKTVGLVAPRLLGDCRCATQDAESSDTSVLLPDYDCVEPVCGAVLALRTSTLRNVAAFAEDMNGYEWLQADLQARLAREGMRTMVAGKVVFRHAQTTAYPPERREKMYRENLDAFCRKNGIRQEFKSRPSSPSLYTPLEIWIKQASLCVVVDSAAGAEKAVRLLAEQGGGELCVVDGSPSPQVVRKALILPEGSRLRYQPRMGGGSAASQAITLAAQDNVRFCELCEGHAIPSEVTEGKRLRFGNRYSLPELETELHVGMAQHYAIGDTLMVTPGLHAIKNKWPHLKITVHHGWEAGDLLLNNPDIDAVERLDKTSAVNKAHAVMPPEATDPNTRNGTEGGIEATFDQFGLPHEGADKRIRLFVTEEERHAARQKLLGWVQSGAGWTRELEEELLVRPIKLVGVQMHGNWRAKFWAHTADLAKRLLSDGWWVVALGNDEKKQVALPENPRMMHGRGMSLREVCALVGQMDAVVGFDSGVTWAASALETPAVCLFGPQDPRGYVLATGAANLATLRRRTPEQCLRERGVSCRHGGAGEHCPFRAELEGQAALGGDCLDEITSDDVMAELAQMPLWGVPLSERVP